MRQSTKLLAVLVVAWGGQMASAQDWFGCDCGGISTWLRSPNWCCANVWDGYCSESHCGHHGARHACGGSCGPTCCEAPAIIDQVKPAIEPTTPAHPKEAPAPSKSAAGGKEESSLTTTWESWPEATALFPSEDDAQIPSDSDAVLQNDESTTLPGNDEAVIPTDEGASIPIEDSPLLPSDDSESIPSDVIE